MAVLFRIRTFLKEQQNYNYFFSESNQDQPRNDTLSESPFEHKSFKLKSSFNSVGPFQLESMFCSIEQDLQKNLTKEEYKAVRSLRNNKNIIIKPVDKGSAIFTLDKLSYIYEGQKQLNNAQFNEQTSTGFTGEAIHRVNLHVHDMLQKGQICHNTCSYLTTDISRAQQFYLLPKIHKNPKNPPGRSVVSGSGGPTERISQFVYRFIGPLIPLS